MRTTWTAAKSLFVLAVFLCILEVARSQTIDCSGVPGIPFDYKASDKVSGHVPEISQVRAGCNHAGMDKRARPVTSVVSHGVHGCSGRASKTNEQLVHTFHES